MTSIEIPAGSLSRLLRDATRFVKRLEDAVPNTGWRFVINTLTGGP